MVIAVRVSLDRDPFRLLRPLSARRSRSASSPTTGNRFPFTLTKAPTASRRSMPRPSRGITTASWSGTSSTAGLVWWLPSMGATSSRGRSHGSKTTSGCTSSSPMPSTSIRDGERLRTRSTGSSSPTPPTPMPRPSGINPPWA